MKDDDLERREPRGSHPKEPQEADTAEKTPELLGPVSFEHPSRGTSELSGGGAGQPERWGHLEIMGKLGSGAFADVYRAWDSRLDREVALKLLRPESLSPGIPVKESSPGPRTANWKRAHVRGATVIREGRLLAKVDHPNVVRVLGADEHDDRIGIWMEFVHGETLSNLVQRAGSLGPKEAFSIGLDLCGALAAVHSAGVIHRDIKAQNVMRAERGRIVLADFGIGLDLEGDKTEERKSVAGTVLYMAPECLRGDDATARSDLYSLGVLLYYLMTGRFPFEARSLADLIAAHEKGTRVFLRDRRPDLSRPVVDAVERALAQSPDDRFASAGEMERALALAMQTLSTEEEETEKRHRRLAALLVLASVLTLLGVGLCFHFLGRYEISASLDRRLPDGGYGPLVSGDRIAVNDQVFLQLRSSKDLYVYVIDRDDAGEMHLLFPHPSLEVQNPLRKGVQHRLPGKINGADVDWKISTPGGQEQFLILGTPRKLTEFEREVKNLDLPGYPQVSDEAVRDIARGVQEFKRVPDSARSRAAPLAEQIFAEASALTARRESVKGAWIRRVVLENPPR